MLRHGILALALVWASNSQAVDLGALGAAVEKAATGTTATSTADTPASGATGGMGDLVGTAMSQLGLSQTQAEGGLGSLFGLAKSNLGADEFGQLAAAVPNMDTLLAAVPALTGGEGGGGGLGGLAGGLASLAGAGDVLKQFEALGLSADMVKPLADLVMQFLGQSGGGDLTSLFTKGLGSLLG